MRGDIKESIATPFLMKSDGVYLSFVIPAFNEEDNIKEVISQIGLEMASHKDKISFEILVIDDGSADNTFKNAINMGENFPVRVIKLSRNFGKEQAITAGLERSRGSAVVLLDADLQEPISYLSEFLRYYEDDYDVVYAVRNHRRDESPLKRILVKVFYWLLSLSYGNKVLIPPDARDFRIMDRRVVNALIQLPERNRFMKGLYAWVGFRSKAVPVELKERANGVSKFGLMNYIYLAVTGITSFTTWPLNLWIIVGFLFTSLSFIYGIWIIIQEVLWGIEGSAFIALTILIFFMGGVQILSIGIIGKYLACVYTEVKGRPNFIISEDSSHTYLNS